MDFGNYHDSDEILKGKKSGYLLNWICMSPFTKYILPNFVLAFVLLASAYLAVLAWLPPENSDRQSTCHLQVSYYIPCLPGRKISREDCLELSCCWRDDLKVCYHTFPSHYGYELSYFNNTSAVGSIRALGKTSPSGKEQRDQLSFYIQEINEHRVRITLTTNTAENNRWLRNSSTRMRKLGINEKLDDFGQLFDFLPPDNGLSRVSKYSPASKNAAVDVFVHGPQFSLTLARPGTENLLMSTARGALIVTDDYWEWSLYLTNGTLYGLNRLELNGTTNWIYNNENETTKASFLAIDPVGNAMACFINYKAPLEIQVLNESNLVILRGISLTEELGIEVLTGGTGLQAAQQLAGATEEMYRMQLNVPMAGLHICPELGNASSALAALKKFIANSKDAPWDSHCFYRQLGLALEHDSSEIDRALVAEARKILLSEEKCLASHLTPMLFNKVQGVLQKTLGQESCLLRNESGVYVGKYEESTGVVYPDWTKSKTHNLARGSLNKYRRELFPDFILLRDSWPKDESENVISDTNFDYLPQEMNLLMSKRTIPYNLEANQHYKVHNVYAHGFVEFVAGEPEQSFMEIRGHTCNNAGHPSWDSLQEILQVGIVSSMTGFLPTGMYVCGAQDHYARLDNELCLRWYGVAVAWPRIIALPEKSPFQGSRLSRSAASQAAKLLKLRASLASYQHTTLAFYFRTGFPILSTTLLFYPNASHRETTLEQFFWGHSILIGLVTKPRHFQVQMWIPDKFPWRHLRGGSPVEPTADGSISITAAIGEIVVLVRPARIVPVHEEVGKSTSETMKKNLKLLANVACENGSCHAEGSIFYGNTSTGEFLNIFWIDGSLTIENIDKVRNVACISDKKIQSTVIEALELLGQDRNFTLQLDLCDYHVSDIVRLSLN